MPAPIAMMMPDAADGAKRDHPAQEGRQERRGGDEERRLAAPAVRRLGCLAGRAQPEQLEPVIVDPEAGLRGRRRATTERRPASSISLVRPQREQTT